MEPSVIFQYALRLCTFGLVTFYEKQVHYYNIIKEFKNKLPRKQNEAKVISEERKKAHPILSDFAFMEVSDVSTHKVTLDEKDIELFYNKLNNFDYGFMFFKKYYKNYTNNLNRFDPKAENKNFHLVIIQKILSNDIKPIKPSEVWLYHLKYELKLSSTCYSLYNKFKNRMNKRNRKK